MKLIAHTFQTINILDDLICTRLLSPSLQKTQSILIQIFSGDTAEQISSLVSALRSRLPQAVIVGASAVGEISNGHISTGGTVILFSLFDSSHVELFSAEADTPTFRRRLARYYSTHGDIKGALVLGTPTRVDVTSFINELHTYNSHIVMFGSCSASHHIAQGDWILAADKVLFTGIAVVLFSGQQLQFNIQYSLGWMPLGKPLFFTEVHHQVVASINHIPAAIVYEYYTGKINYNEFLTVSTIFSFMVERNNTMVPRTAIMADDHQALHFLADIHSGEQFQFGVCNPGAMHAETEKIINNLIDFKPEGEFIYSCGVRRLLLQDVANLETSDFNLAAENGGLYGYGEIYACNSQPLLLNGSLVIVGIKECDAIQPDSPSPLLPVGERALPSISLDPYARNHARIITHLLSFMQAITTDLHIANQSLHTQSITDKLTQLHNRNELDSRISEEVATAGNFHVPLSIILVDLDHFKQVNDRHGHLVGDKVLVHVSKLLRATVRNADIVGRWGGEEFMVIAPRTTVQDAQKLAERLRAALVQQQLPDISPHTASFGVTQLVGHESVSDFINRADKALYQAKEQGRNRVCVE